MLDREDSQLVNHARVLGDKGLKIYLEDPELLRLCAIVAADLQQVHLITYFDDTEDLERGYYGFPNEWFKRPVHEKASFEYIFKHFKSSIQDFATYFKSLCEIREWQKSRVEKISNVVDVARMCAFGQLPPIPGKDKQLDGVV